MNGSAEAMLKKDAQSVNHSKEGNNVRSSAESTDNWESTNTRIICGGSTLQQKYEVLANLDVWLVDHQTG